MRGYSIFYKAFQNKIIMPTSGFIVKHKLIRGNLKPRPAPPPKKSLNVSAETAHHTDHMSAGSLSLKCQGWHLKSKQYTTSDTLLISYTISKVSHSNVNNADVACRKS